MKIQVIYWTQGGNTKAMAEAVAKGITEAGSEAEVLSVGEASVEALKEAEALALGCPAMGAEELEESEMEPFVSSIESFITGKKVALFGSYGWGDGQWMRDWVERMTKAGATVVGDNGVICQETPDDTALGECIALGKLLITG